MAALPNDRWRAYVLAFFATRPGHGQYRSAAKIAGLGNVDGTSSDNAISVLAHRIAHDTRFVAALHEEGAKRLKTTSPAAISALANLIDNANHKDHARAIGMVLDRVHAAETTHHVQVTHRHIDPDEEALEILEALRSVGASREKMEELLGFHELPRIERLAAQRAKIIEGKVIEHEADVIEADVIEGADDLDGLADVL
jgi:hypothetical protein